MRHFFKPGKGHKVLLFLLLPLIILFLFYAVIGKIFLQPSNTRPLAVLPQPSSYPSPSLIPSTTPVLSEVVTLATVNKHGGLCRTGNECSNTVAIMADGRVLMNGKEKTQLSTKAIAEISDRIAETDFATIKHTKFVGECPTAYDGQETIYSLSVAGNVEVIKSCDVAVDPSHPLFSTLDRIFLSAFE